MDPFLYQWAIAKQEESGEPIITVITYQQNES